MECSFAPTNRFTTTSGMFIELSVKIPATYIELLAAGVPLNEIRSTLFFTVLLCFLSDFIVFHRLFTSFFFLFNVADSICSCHLFVLCSLTSISGSLVLNVRNSSHCFIKFAVSVGKLL